MRVLHKPCKHRVNPFMCPFDPTTHVNLNRNLRGGMPSAAIRKPCVFSVAGCAAWRLARAPAAPEAGLSVGKIAGLRVSV